MLVETQRNFVSTPFNTFCCKERSFRVGSACCTISYFAGLKHTQQKLEVHADKTGCFVMLLKHCPQNATASVEDTACIQVIVHNITKCMARAKKAVLATIHHILTQPVSSNPLGNYSRCSGAGWLKHPGRAALMLIMIATGLWGLALCGIWH